MTGLVERAFALENEIGLPVRCDLRRPQGPGPWPVVVLLHGFKGFKDWGMFPPTARALAARGLAVVGLNTSRNGVEERFEEFTDLEAFARNTPRREMRDVGRVIDAVAAGEIDASLDGDRIALLGHSRGGGIVLLAAAGDPRVKCVVTWAAIATFHRYTERALAEWRRKGRIDIPNARTGQTMWLEREVLDDLEASREEYDVEAACRRLTAPLLVVDGALDEAVDVADAERIVAAAAAPPVRKRKLVIAKAGHTFGAVHPWAGPPPAWEEAVRASGDWFAEHLRR